MRVFTVLRLFRWSSLNWFDCWWRNEFKQIRLNVLSSCQTVTTFLPNTWQHFRAQHVANIWSPCCEVLRHVGCCWLKVENGQIICSSSILMPNILQHVATGWPNTRNVVPNSVATCCVEMLRSFGRSLQILGQQCWDKLCWYVVIIWPGLMSKQHLT